MNGNSHAMPVTLSVVLPNYNHAKFIGRALAALLGQERAADEVVVIDDGSTDDSVAVIERIAAATPAIRMLRNPNNIAVISTLQRGLEAARGKYVYFAASDDLIFPGFFSRWRCAGSRPIPTLACSAGKRC
jgi:glycosyltransferase involved in cell wall biosynthesis